MASLTNTSNSSTAEYGIDEVGVYISDLITEIVLVLATCLPNLLQLYLFIFKIKERTYSNACFLSLITCDFFVGALCLPTNIFYLNPFIKVSYNMGIFITLVSYAQPNTGILTLVLLTWHRLGQVARPTKSTEKLTRIRVAVIIGVWILQYAIWIVIIWVMIRIGYYNPNIPDITPPDLILLLLDIVFFVMPVAVNVALITATIVELAFKRKSHIQNARKIQPDTSLKMAHGRGKRFLNLSRSQKAILCLLTMITTLVATQTLYFVTWPLSGYRVIHDAAIQIVSSKLLYANSILNPIILFIFHEKVRSETTRLFRSLFCCSFSLAD